MLRARITTEAKRNTTGQGIVEYLLLLALISFGVVAALPTLACRMQCAFENVATQLEYLLTTGKKVPPGQARKCTKECGETKN